LDKGDFNSTIPPHIRHSLSRKSYKKCNIPTWCYVFIIPSSLTEGSKPKFPAKVLTSQLKPPFLFVLNVTIIQNSRFHFNKDRHSCASSHTFFKTLLICGVLISSFGPFLEWKNMKSLLKSYCSHF
jgi:hypothetical protein